MKKETLAVWQEGEYSYPLAFGFVPNLVSYIHEEDTQEWPCMLVVPGGGYCVVSPTEGEIVAMEFYEKGYNAFVFTYTTNPLMLEPLKEQSMRDLSRAIRLIRSRAGEFHIDPCRLILCGFSAGGHLCASVCVHYMDVEDGRYGSFSNRPDAAILSYPVITSADKAHRGSFQALLGMDAAEEELEYMSLEKQVSPQTPPCFLWQTATDEAVPVENSYLFAEALKENGVPFAHHVFSEGRHGLSLANEKWANGEYGEPYTMEQTLKIAENVKNGNIQVSEEVKESFLPQFERSEEETKALLAENSPNDEVAVWPVLAHQWIKAVLKPE